MTSTPTLSLDQLEDDIIDERLQVIKEYAFKNIVPRNDLLMSINCINVDCLSLDKCPCNTVTHSSPEMHFEIPQIVNDLGEGAIEYIGSIDRLEYFKVYTTTAYQFHKDLRRGSNRPYVYIEPTPNSNNMYDAWIFGAPLLKVISVIGIFKDPRQLLQYDCCNTDELENYSSLSSEIKKRLTEKKIRYYRQFAMPSTPNTQEPK